MYVCLKEYLLAGFYNQIVQEGSSVLLHALHRGGGVRGVRGGRGDCPRQHRGREWQRAAVRGRGRGDRGERADHGAVRPPRHQDPGNLLLHVLSCHTSLISPPPSLLPDSDDIGFKVPHIYYLPSTIYYLPPFHHKYFIFTGPFTHWTACRVVLTTPWQRPPAHQLLTGGHRTYTATWGIRPAQSPLFIEPLLSAGHHQT